MADWYNGETDISLESSEQETEIEDSPNSGKAEGKEKTNNSNMISELLKERLIRKSTAPATAAAPQKQKISVVEVKAGSIDKRARAIRQIKPYKSRTGKIM